MRTTSCVEVAQAIRDDLGYDYLSSVTGVDYLEQGLFRNRLSRLFNCKGGGPLVFKARTPRDVAEIPSVVERLAQRGFSRARSLRHVRHSLHGASRPAPHFDVGRLCGLSAPQGLERSRITSKTKSPSIAAGLAGTMCRPKSASNIHDNVAVDPAAFNV